MPYKRHVALYTISEGSAMIFKRICATSERSQREVPASEMAIATVLESRSSQEAKPYGKSVRKVPLPSWSNIGALWSR